MDWIHCNNCFSQLDPGITLHLTSCGHMFCNNCLNNGSQQSTCLVCRMPCSIMKLVPDMKPEVQDYFTEPEEIIKKCCEVLQFQKQHRRRLLSYLFQSTKKFYTARTELRRMTELCQKQHKQLKEFQKTIKHLESQISQTKQASPFNIPISPGSNVSPNFVQVTPTYKRTAKSTPYSTKKFYTARTELRRMTELCQKQHKQLKEFQKTIKHLESQISQTKQASPFNIPISPGSNVSPNFVQVTPTYKRTAKSTPYSQPYQSNLVTPSRISKQRTSNFTPQSQRSNTSNKISSTVFTPPTPESVGYLSQCSIESGYISTSPVLYCNGYDRKCSLKMLGLKKY